MLARVVLVSLLLVSSLLSANNTASTSFWSYGSATEQGLRQYQEDRILIIANHSQFGVFGVFDGHGGAEASDFALKNFYSRFVHHLSSQVRDRGLDDQPDQYRRVLERALRAALQDIEDLFLVKKWRSRAGSTACVAVVTEEFVLVANIGDSRAVVCKPGSSPTSRSQQLTRDHHPELPDERARIEAAGGRVVFTGWLYRVDGNLAMSRAIGDRDLKAHGVIAEPEITEYGVGAGRGSRSYLVITSDGVFESMTNEEVCRMTGTGAGSTSLDAVASKIVRRALNMGSLDNISVVLVPL